jgi:hypothetical protein
MNSLRLLGLFLALAVTSQAGPAIANPPGPSQPTVTNEAVNYTIRVEWKDAKKGTNSLQVVTSQGNFELDTVSGSVKINDSDVPSTVKLTGFITELNPEKARFQMFLGRTVPYVTSTFAGSGGGKSSSYSQMSVGLQSTFIVTFGMPLVVQTDDNGTVSILVKRDVN